MPFETHTQVYTVRLWRERRERAESEELWRGRVELLLTGEGVFFQDMERLVSFILRTSGAVGMERRPGEDRAGGQVSEAGRPAARGAEGEGPGSEKP